jgi:MFS family permease
MHEPADEDAVGPEAARRRTRRWLVAMLLPIFLLVAAGMVVGFLAASRHSRPGRHHSAVGFIAIAAVSVLVLVVTGLIVWRLVRRPDYQRAMQYPWRRRMRVAKALRRGDPIGPEDLAVAAAVIAGLRTQKLNYFVQPFVIASWVLIAITRHGYGRWLYVGLALVAGAALAYSGWVHRRTVRNWHALSHRSAGPEPDLGAG